MTRIALAGVHAQSTGTLHLRMNPLSLVLDSTTAAMPASHRSAKQKVDRLLGVE
jgi:hypothetical protein